MPFTLSRSVLAVLVPGLIAVAPWALLLAFHLSDFAELYKTYSVLVNGSLLAAAVIIGSLIEGAVSYVEVVWDRERERKYKVRENWFEYLSLHSVGEPIGFQYLSRMVTTMYFELAMMAATPISIGGAALLTFLYATGPWRYATAVLVVVMVVAAWVFYSLAKTSHLVLCEARREINARLKRSSGPERPKPKLVSRESMS